MEFINLINSTGLSKQDIDSVTGKDVPLSSIIKHHHVKDKGKIQALETGVLHKGKVKLRLHKDENIIKQLEFICSCGETAIIDVEYVDTNEGENDA